MTRRLSLLLVLGSFLGGLTQPQVLRAREGAEPEAAAKAEETVLSSSGIVSSDVLPAGGRAEVAFRIKLNGSWHVNAHVPADPLLIPTKLTLDPVPGLRLGQPVFPEPTKRKFEFSDDPLLVYAHVFTVRVAIEADSDLAPGPREMRGKLRYQACDDERCLAPREETVTVTVVVAAADAPAKPLHPEIFGVPDGPARGPGSETVAPAPAGASPTGMGSSGSPSSAAGGNVTPADAGVSQVAALDAAAPSGSYVERLAKKVVTWIAEGSYGFAFVLLFLVGLGLSFTPCVYPVIPITVSYFANQSDRRGGKTFSLAVVYVLGMAAMYSSLGVIAALSGKAFGSALASPWVLVFEATVMVALALSMFGLWEIGIPGFLATRLGASPSGHAGALFMGLTVGIVAAPCIGPAILALFTFVAARGSVPLGFGIFFVFALGLGFPFLLLGSVSGAVSRLPRSGEWMIWVKHFFGFLLLGLAIYFLRPLAGDALFFYGIPLLGLVAGVYLGFLDPAGRASAAFRRFRAVAGVLIAVLSVSVLALGRATKEQLIRWQTYEDAAFASALKSGRPVLVDFTAEWCIPCKELEHLTFTDERVGRAASRFSAFRADGTVEGDPVVAALLQRYDVKGYPTILLIDSKGSERADLRVVGFLKPEDFERRLQRVD